MLRRLVVLFLVLASAVTVTTVAVGLSENFVDPCEEGHAWEEIFNVGATCTEEGIVVKQCAVCGEKSEETTPALGHDLATVPGSAVDPTCTDKGCTATTKCTRTNCDYEVKGESIPAINHKYGDIISVGDGTHKWVCENDSKHEVISDCKGGTATCTEKAVCEECDGAYGEYASHVYDQEVVDDEYLKSVANCTYAACYYKSCVCGHFDETESGTFYNGETAGHVFDREVAEEQYLVSVATCEDKAVYNKSCVCGLEGTDTFEHGEALGHAWDNGTVTIDPTCEGEGEMFFVCGNDSAHTKTEVVSALGHAWDNGTVTIDPTCEGEGEMSFVCGNDSTHTKTEVVSALGHAWDEGTITTPATCTTAGEKTFTCGNDANHTKTEEISATGHTGSETINTCATCGSEITVDDIHAMTKTLAESKYLTGKYQLSGTIVSISGKNILINVSGSTAKFEITAYNTIGDAVANLVVGDVITVSGSIKNYYGTIEFEKPTLDSVYHTVAIEEGANGSVTANVEGLIANGTSATITVTPDTGYELDNFYVDGAVVEIENNTYTFVVEKSVKIEVTFKVIGSQGEVVAETLVLKHNLPSDGTSTNMSGENDANTFFNLDTAEWSVVGTKNKASNNVGINKAGDFRIYYNASGSNTFTVSSPVYIIKSIKMSFTGAQYSNVTVSVDGKLVTAVDGEYTINASAFVLGNGNTSNVQVRINQVEIKYVPVSSAPACTHENTEVTKVGQASTCEVAGWTDEITCTSCGEIVTASVALPLADHTEGQAERDNVVDSSCSAEGSYDSVVKCTVCDKELSREEGLVIEKKPHTEVTDDAVEPDCTNTGLTAGSHCFVCGEVIVAQQVVPANGHTEEIDQAVSATCMATGLTAGSHCSVCGEVIVAQQVVPVDENAHAWNEGVVTTDPGCTTVGEKTYTCTLNGEHTKTEEVSATGHKDENPVDGRCDSCGTSLCAEHDYDEGVVSLEPTCEDDGVKTYTCSVCGDIKTETLDALGHAWDNGVISTPATCVSVGEKTYTCANDNSHTKTEEIAIDETAHAYNEGVVTTPATCVSVGEKTYTCTLNGEHTKTEEIAFDETAHAYGNWNEEVSADCTTNGTKGHYACSNEGCGKYFDAEYNVIADIVILASHDYDAKGECSKCHAIKKEGAVATFEFGANGAASNYDGTKKTEYSETNNGYTLTLSSMTNMYTGARDDKGNSTIKGGASSSAGSFSFTVPADVTSVTIHIAKYGTDSTKVQINGTTYTLTMLENNGEYDVLVIDTTATKTVSIASATASKQRFMINTIVFNSVTECDHENTLSENTVDVTCTTNGYTRHTCSACAHYWDTDIVTALGHDEEMAHTEAKAATCVAEGNVEYYTCSKCNVKFADAEGVTALDNVVIAINEDNHANLVTIPGTSATCEEDGLTDGQKCEACGVTTIEQTIIYAIPCVDDNNDGACDSCGNDLCAHTNKVDKEEVPATCVETGLTAGVYCEDCDKYLEGGASIPATGEHNYTELVETSDTTHTYKCATCEDRKESAHELQVVENSANGDTHTEKCACDYTVTDATHNFENGDCACGQEKPESKSWKRATSIAVSDIVTLVCESKTMELGAMNTSSGYGPGVGYTTAPAGAYSLTVEEGTTSGTYAFKTSDGKYLTWTSSNSLKLATTKSANTSWTVTFSGNNAIIKNAYDSTRQIQWNASSPRFAAYTSTQTAIQLYVYA